MVGLLCDIRLQSIVELELKLGLVVSIDSKAKQTVLPDCAADLTVAAPC